MSNLTPVPRGMCPAFYEFMGAGAPRSDSGEILMLANSRPCTCLGTCRGSQGLGVGWHCVLEEKKSNQR